MLLRIARNEFVVMFGVSGCGKTTLLNLIGALDVPSAGTIVVDGERISSMTERARTRFRANKVGFVFQFYNLLPTLTALENVEAALEILPLDSSAQSGPALAQHIVDRPKAGHSNPTAKAKKRLTCHERFKSQIESQPFLANRPFLH
jgi:putative ABC transport system ATP-binding protein